MVISSAQLPEESLHPKLCPKFMKDGTLLHLPRWLTTISLQPFGSRSFQSIRSPGIDESSTTGKGVL